MGQSKPSKRVGALLKKQFLPSLSTEQRLILLLVYAEGLTAEEAAAILHKPARFIAEQAREIHQIASSLVKRGGSVAAA